MSGRSAVAARVLPGIRGRISGGFLLFVLLVLAAVPVFAAGVAELLAAWSTAEYSHGPLIPLVSLYLFLREMRRMPPPAPAARVRDRWPGVLVMAAALALAILGNLTAIPDIVAYAIILWVSGLVLAGFGWERGRRHQLPVLHLIFMLPLPQVLYWQISTALQGVSSVIGVAIVDLAGIPVYLDGNVIDLGVYKLQVAEACSGLRYLFPILSFSYLFAILYRGPLWHKAALLVSAAPIAVAMNAIRIGIIGVLVDAYGIAQAEGFLHLFEGWAIFLACVGLLMAMAVGLQRLTPDPLPLSRAIDLDFAGFGTELARLPRMAGSGALAACVGLTALAAAALVAGPGMAPGMAPGSGLDRDGFTLFPRQIGAWVGARRVLEPEIEAILAADDTYLADYVRSGPGAGSGAAAAAPVNLFMVWFADQTTGAIHSPEVCLPAGGWEVSGIETHDVHLPGLAPFAVNRAVIQKGLEQQLVYYWFEQRGRRMTSDVGAKLATLADRVRTGRADGGLIRVITPIPPGTTETQADARLRDFLSTALPRLDRFVPE